MLKKLLLASTLLASPAYADVVSVGFFDPAQGVPGIQTIGTTTGPIDFNGPLVDLIGAPLILGSGFGFGQIAATVIQPGGNVVSGGLPGSTIPTFEFAFDDGFTPPQGGTIYLYATWSGVNTSDNAIMMPSLFNTWQIPPGSNGITVKSDIRLCPDSNFCGAFTSPGVVPPGGEVTAQDATLNTGVITLASIAPGQPFTIGETFAFSSTGMPPTGDVGSFIMTSAFAPTPVPGPVVGAGLPGLFSLIGLWWYRRRSNKGVVSTHANPS
jgi:hypothetical protein